MSQVEQIREAFIAERNKLRPDEVVCNYLRRALNRLIVKAALSEPVREVPFVESVIVDAEGRTVKRLLALQEGYNDPNTRHGY